MTKSAAQGSATAARSSSGRAASCARPADTARNAEVPRPGGAGAPPAGQGSAGLTPSRHRLIRPQRQRALLVCRAQLREYFTVLGDAEVVMNPVQKEDMLSRDLGHVRQKQREGKENSSSSHPKPGLTEYQEMLQSEKHIAEMPRGED